MICLLFPFTPDEDGQWGAMFMDDQKMGHVRLERRVEDGLHITVRETVMRISGLMEGEVRTRVKAVETADGKLVLFSARSGGEGDVLQISAEIADGKIELAMGEEDFPHSQEMPLQGPILGPEALRKHRQGKGLEPGTEYEVRAIGLDLGGLGVLMTHRVAGEETVSLLDGEGDLHRIDIRLSPLPYLMMHGEGLSGSATVWVDDDLRVRKQRVQGVLAPLPGSLLGFLPRDIVWGPREMAISGPLDVFRPGVTFRDGWYRNHHAGVSFRVPEGWDLARKEDGDLLAVMESEGEVRIDIRKVMMEGPDFIEKALGEYTDGDIQPKQPREEGGIGLAPFAFEGGRACMVAGTSWAAVHSGTAFLIVLKPSTPDAEKAFEDLLGTVRVGIPMMDMDMPGAPPSSPRYAEMDTALHVVDAHAAAVTSLAVSPDGRLAVSGGLDGTVNAWNLLTGRRVEVREHTGPVRCVAIGPEGKSIFAGGEKGGVRTWDVRWPQAKATFAAHSGPVGGIAVAPDGKSFATAGLEDGLIRIWKAPDGGLPRTLEGHGKGVASVAFSPDGRMISGSLDGDARIWDLETGETVHEIGSADGGVARVAWSPDGKEIALTSGDGTVRILDSGDFAEIRGLPSRTGIVETFAFSPDWGVIAMPGVAGHVTLWRRDRPEPRRDRSIEGGTIGTIAFSPDGRLLLAGMGDGSIAIWNLRGGHPPFSTEIRDRESAERGERVLRGHGAPVLSVAFSPDGQSLVSTSYDDTARIWDLETGLESRTLWGGLDACRAAAFHPDGGQVVLIPGSGTGSPSLWDSETGEVVKSLPGERWESFSPAVAFLPDGKGLITASEKRWPSEKKSASRLCLSDLDTGDVVRTFEGHAGRVESFAVTGDGKTLVTGGGDASIRIWNTADGVEKGVLTGHRGALLRVAVSSDGSHVASVGSDQTLRIWRTAGGVEIFKAERLPAELTSVAFSPDGKRIATGMADFTVGIRSVPEGEVQKVLTGVSEGLASAGIHHVAFSPDGTTVAVAGGDGTVRLWTIH
jgi:WD40 repeat protein